MPPVPLTRAPGGAGCLWENSVWLDGQLLLGGLREPADNEIEAPPTHSFPVPAAARNRSKKVDELPPGPQQQQQQLSSRDLARLSLAAGA